MGIQSDSDHYDDPLPQGLSEARQGKEVSFIFIFTYLAAAGAPRRGRRVHRILIMQILNHIFLTGSFSRLLLFWYCGASPLLFVGGTSCQIFPLLLDFNCCLMAVS